MYTPDLLYSHDTRSRPTSPINEILQAATWPLESISFMNPISDNAHPARGLTAIGQASYSEVRHHQGRLRMKWKQAWRVGQVVVVIGSCASVLVFGGGLAHDVRAPLFAIVAAMGLSLTTSARADQKWQEYLQGFVAPVTIAAAGFSGLEWLKAADAGLAIEALGAAGAALASLAFVANSWMTRPRKKTAPTMAVEPVNTLINPCGND